LSGTVIISKRLNVEVPTSNKHHMVWLPVKALEQMYISRYCKLFSFIL